MTMSRTRRLCSVLTAILLSLTVTSIAAPSATAVSYGECNSGWSVLVEVVGGNGGGAYVPARSDRTGASRSCWLAQNTSGRSRDEVRKLQYGLQSTGYSISADGYFGRITHDSVHNLQWYYGIPADGVYGPRTGSLMTWCYWYNSIKSCGRWI